MVSLFLYIKNQHDQLVNCLNSITQQTNHEFALHLCLDGTNQAVNELISQHDFRGIKAVIVHKTDTAVGNGFFYHLAKTIGDGDYVWFGNSYCTFAPNFIALITQITTTDHPELIDFSRNHNAKNHTVDIFNIRDLFFHQDQVTPFIYDKLFSTTFLNAHNICFNQLHTQPLAFIYDVFACVENVYKVNEPVFTYIHNRQEFDNIYDIIYMAQNIVKQNQNTDFWKNYYVLIEYVAIVHILCIFLYNIYKNNDDPIILKNAVNSCKALFDETFKNWRDNQIIQQKNQLNDDVCHLLRNFNFKKKDINALINLLDQQYYSSQANE